jgi:lipopolysaccharide/colanic/teichoic acid biosynthesis glycosyltransferase
LYGILAAGRPFVAAVDDGCEVASIARTRECGLVARPGDAADLADKVLAFYRDREMTLRFGANARSTALAFDRSEQVRKYAEMFRGLRRAAPAGESAGTTRAIAKRAFDIALSAAGLLVSLPVWALIGAAIKIEDGGPVFYTQDRVGKGGSLFRVLKFRSMVSHAEETAGALQASEHDPRITRVGLVLRATAMDELPQLWNVLRGDMSFVGPRALRPGEIEVGANGRMEALEEVPGFDARCRVRPGLTGVAQIYAPRDIPRRRKFRYDRLYLPRQSFGLDLRLIALSFWITFRGSWEVRGRKF